MKVSANFAQKNSHQDIYWNEFEKLTKSEHRFFDLPSIKNCLADSKKVFEKFKNRKHFIHLGLGGSSLGPELLINALANPQTRDFIFINNIDSDDVFDKINHLAPKDCLFYLVSKSGNTAESLALFCLLENWIKSRVENYQTKDYFVFCTDPKSGPLRELSQKINVETLNLPSELGGRFSVLSPVGFLPCLFAGINCQELIDGAMESKKEIETRSEKFSFEQMGSLVFALSKKGVNQTVLMPYSSKLKTLSLWFVQLWAESLGKITEQKEHVGLTPLFAYGPTDQHSQMQLFMEGPKDKLIIFVKVEKTKHTWNLTNNYENKNFKQLAKTTLHQLLTAELKGTEKALNTVGRETVLITIPEVNAYHVGLLIHYFESLTVLVSCYLKVNPFNQPGVELAKRLTFENLV